MGGGGGAIQTRTLTKWKKNTLTLSLIPKECLSGAKSPGYFAVFGSVILLSFSQPVKEEGQVQNSLGNRNHT